MADMTLEEALAAATVDDALETSYCTVDDDTRLVTVPEKYTKLGVESDEKAKRVWFRFPKMVGNNGIDLSEISVRVNFRNANGDGDIYVVEDVTPDGDYVIFSWELTRDVTAYKGHISFVVCAVKSSSTGVVKNEWNTTLNKECEVLEGLEVTEQIVQENPDIIEYILANLGGSVSAEQIAEAVEEYMLAHPIEVPENLSDLNEDATHRTVTDEEKAKWDKAEENVQSDWNETDSTSDAFVKNKPSIPSKTSDLNNDSNFISSPATAEVGQVLEVEAIDENGKPSSWKTVTLEDGIANVEMSSTDTEVTIEPLPKAYIFPEMSELIISLETGKEKEMYHFSFISGDTATTLTLNNITVVSASDAVEVSKTYEVDVWNQIAVVKAVA